jgi:phosphatidylglycerophosphatase A
MVLVIATGFGAGFSPIASGTFGTLVAIPFHLAIARLDPWLQVLTTAGFCALAMFAADRAGAYYGASDDGRIVSDEVAGYLVTMLLVPPSVKAVAAGFLLFRILDIAKPWPASYFDRRVHTGVGNVLDDLFAALYGRAGMALLLYLWP